MSSFSNLAIETVVCDEWFRDKMKEGLGTSLEISSEKTVCGSVFVMRIRRSAESDHARNSMLDLKSIADPSYVVQTSGMSLLTTIKYNFSTNLHSLVLVRACVHPRV